LRSKLLGSLLSITLISPLAAQAWSQSFTAGRRDASGAYMGGSEILHLVGHGGSLYAAVGYWQDGGNLWYGGRDPKRGWAQILRLDAPDGDWEVDLELGPLHLRPEVLAELTFRTDGSGRPLDTPATLLLTCAYALNLTTTSVHCFVREDTDGQWTKVKVFGGRRARSEAFSVRDVHVHRDAVTNVDRVFLTIGTQGVFSGVYDADVPGKIAWDEKPEIGPLRVRPLGIATADDALFFSSGDRIYRREDGPKPSYEVVHDLSDLAPFVRSAVGGVRGLTAVPSPSGEGDSLLFMWAPNARSRGEMHRLDRGADGRYERHRETTLAELVRDHVGADRVSYLLGAYNDLLAIRSEDAGEMQHLVGLECRVSGDEVPTWKKGYYRGALFAVRDADGGYHIDEVGGGTAALEQALVATRCYAHSPFEGDRAIYFGGHDPNGIPSTNMAWVYRKSIATPDASDAGKQE
jgi:hypothetical protein